MYINSLILTSIHTQASIMGGTYILVLNHILIAITLFLHILYQICLYML